MAAKDGNSRKRTLDKLGEYAAAGSTRTSADELLKLHANEGDRGLVIILASQLEDALFDRICEALENGKSERRALMKGGPLRSFEQRIVMARAMGILGRTEAEVFDVFRHMRNACAHSRRDISFQTPELREALILLSPRSEERLLDGTLDPAATLIFVAAWMFNFLAGLAHEEIQERVTLLTETYREIRLREARLREPASSPRTPRGKPSLGAR